MHPSSACVPSVLLPAKNLSRSSSMVSSSSSVEGYSGWRDHVQNRKTKPGFINPVFYDDGQNKVDSIQLEPIRPIHKPPKSFPEDLQHDIPNKALPKYLVQYSVTKEGVFDSKESADSGISKGSMVHQSSNERIEMIIIVRLTAIDLLLIRWISCKVDQLLMLPLGEGSFTKKV